MQTTTSGVPVQTIEIRVTDPPIELYVTEKAFRPNPTTVRFSRTAHVAPGDVVFDIGTGVGPLAIYAAKAGARHVYAVDPVATHCELARMNVCRHGLADVISVHEGTLFEPFETDPELAGVKADVIIGDVSGIAEPVARAMGWYSDEVPTGGEDGTDVIIDLLRAARKYLTTDGEIFFPIAVDLSDSDKILKAARELYHCVDNAMDRPTTQFPMSPQEVEAVQVAYADERPSYINIQDEGGRRAHWRGQIWKASEPK